MDREGPAPKKLRPRVTVQQGGSLSVPVRHPNADPVLGGVAAASLANTGALLLRRRTYQGFYAARPNQPDNPSTALLNTTHSHVAPTTCKQTIP